MRNTLDNAEYWYQHKVYPPLECAARFHHKLVYIHPFANGNGRHARIMADTLLKRFFAVAPINWAGGSSLEQMGSRRTMYLKALRAADKGDFNLLMHFVNTDSGKS